MLIAKLQLVSSELDHWENGCQLDCNHVSNWELEFSAENEENLINKMTAYFLCDRSYFVFNSCDENGRVDIQLQTKEPFDSFPINKYDMDLFKQNKIKAYLTNFTFQVYEQTEYKFKTESL